MPSSWWNGLSDRAQTRISSATTRIASAAPTKNRSGTAGCSGSTAGGRGGATLTGASSGSERSTGGGGVTGVRRAAAPRAVRGVPPPLRRADLDKAVFTCGGDLRELAEELVAD